MAVVYYVIHLFFIRLSQCEKPSTATLYIPWMRRTAVDRPKALIHLNIRARAQTASLPRMTASSTLLSLKVTPASSQSRDHATILSCQTSRALMGLMMPDRAKSYVRGAVAWKCYCTLVSRLETLRLDQALSKGRMTRQYSGIQDRNTSFCRSTIFLDASSNVHDYTTFLEAILTPEFSGIACRTSSRKPQRII